VVHIDNNFRDKGMSMKLLLVGATGLVGRHVLRLALADSRISAVVTPLRRPMPLESAIDRKPSIHTITSDALI
jgi:uncharacterized protein YbjT (DUF2867 family)